MTTQTPADIKLPPLPALLALALTHYADAHASGKFADEERAKVTEEIESYALACVEADRKEQDEKWKQICATIKQN